MNHKDEEADKWPSHYNSLLNAEDGKPLELTCLQAFWFNDWVKSLSLCQETSDLGFVRICVD
jgi:hypothetical protein